MEYKNNRKLEIGIFRFILKENKKFPSEASIKLRGCILNNFNDKIEYHNHIDEYTFNYKSPLVQYKVIEGVLSIVAMDYMVEILRNDLKNLTNLKIGNEEFDDFEIIEEVSTEETGVFDELYSYTIEIPWLALNDRNYQKYKEGKFDLSKQIRNNIIEFMGSIDVFVEKKIMTKGIFEELPIKHKENTLLGFNGAFISNVKLPDYISLGKRKSLGYGMIKEEKA